MVDNTDKFFEYASKYLNGKELLLAEDLEVVLKAHLLVEEALDLLINAYVFNDKKQKDLLDWFNLRFSKKVDLVQFRGLLEDKHIKSIRTMNEIRNKFAHNLGFKFSDIKPLLNAFCQPYEAKLEKVVEEEHRKEVNEVCRLKFGLCVYYILGLILTNVENKDKK